MRELKNAKPVAAAGLRKKGKKAAPTLGILKRQARKNQKKHGNKRPKPE